MHKNPVRTVSIMMALSLLGKVLGLLRDLLFGYFYGTQTVESVAFKAASTVPRLFLDVVFASAITASFIPIFNEYNEQKGYAEAHRLSNVFITLVLLVASVISIVAMVFSRQLVGLAFSDFSQQAQSLTAQLLVIMLPLVAFSGVAFCFTGVLQSLGEFNIPAAMSVVSNAVIIVYSVIFLRSFGVVGLAVVYLFGWLLQVLIQVPSLNKKGYRFRPSLEKHPALKEIGILMLPIMISSWIQPINFMVNFSVAARVQEGAGSAALDYANTLYLIIIGVFILSVSNLVFPSLSKLQAKDDTQRFSESLSGTLRVMFFLLVPMTVGIFLLSRPLISLLYQRGLFDETSTQLTSTALKYFSLGIVGYGVQTILYRGFYAKKNALAPLLTAVLAVAVNSLLSIVLVGPLGVGGPALASAVSMSLVGLVLVILMNKTNKIINKKMLTDLLKILLASAFMGAVVSLSMDLFHSNVLVVIVPTVLGLGVYAAITYLLRIDEALIFFNMLGKIRK